MTGEAYWHRLDIDAAFDRLDSRPTGLAEAVAVERLRQYGVNAIVEQARRPLWRMLTDQFADFMILVLVAAAMIAGLVGDPQDSIAIVIIVLLNAILGAVQEYRAERAVAALRRMVAPEATVIRDGPVHTMPADGLVPGDVVLLEAGNAVPADLRLIECAELAVDESALTGESRPVQKTIAPLVADHLPLGDRTNLAFKGTLITRGRGRGLVVATGMQTELGRIAAMLRGAAPVRTPLQRRLTGFGRRLAVAILGICALIFVAGLLRGEPVILMFLTAVSLAVAAIPEALPAVVTVSLAFGAAKMSRRNVLIRRLPAVETLGSVTYICADKTGTLTENQMRLERVVIGDATFDSLADIGGETARILGQALALSNDVRRDADGGPVGEPTEVALYQAAAAVGMAKADLERSLPRIAELPFDSTRKRMSTLHRNGAAVWVFCKGAPESVLPLCRDRHDGGLLDADVVLDRASQLADEGYRVLALGCRRLNAVPTHLGADVETQLSLLGLVALIDPPRAGVRDAVAECMAAGITPVMITGDHPGTAKAIGQRLGICGDGDGALTGRDLENMNADQFAEDVERVRIYARVSPEQKISIVRALQQRGQFAAMTGDGVNDAPALKMANIGVAMGKKGTDVAREAADMVLLDDNFTTIVSAVREGRRIYDNVRKFVNYTMSSNAGEIWTLLLAPFFGLPIPLLPIHILWINLVTDGLPGLAFAAEPADGDIMCRPPRPPDESIFAHGIWQHVIWVGLFIGGLAIASQAWAHGRGVEHWQTVVFTVLTLSQLFHALAVRSERLSLFSIGILSNPAMLAAVLLTIGLHLMVVYVPVFNDIFHTQPLPLSDLAVCFAISASALAAVEFEKWLARRGLIYQAQGGEKGQPRIRR